MTDAVCFLLGAVLGFIAMKVLFILWDHYRD